MSANSFRFNSQYSFSVDEIKSDDNDNNDNNDNNDDNNDNDDDDDDDDESHNQTIIA